MTHDEAFDWYFRALVAWQRRHLAAVVAGITGRGAAGASEVKRGG